MLTPQILSRLSIIRWCVHCQHMLLLMPSGPCTCSRVVRATSWSNCLVLLGDVNLPVVGYQNAVVWSWNVYAIRITILSMAIIRVSHLKFEVQRRRVEHRKVQQWCILQILWGYRLSMGSWRGEIRPKVDVPREAVRSRDQGKVLREPCVVYLLRMQIPRRVSTEERWDPHWHTRVWGLAGRMWGNAQWSSSCNAFQMDFLYSLLLIVCQFVLVHLREMLFSFPCFHTFHQ